MVYSNFLTRILISIIFFISYFTLAYFNFHYIYFFILFIYILILLKFFLYFKKYKIFIIFYLLLTLIQILNIDFKNENFIIFHLMIFIVICFDIFSYLVGTYFGKTKILFTISPNKTLEGLFGGILFTLILIFIYLNIFNINISIQLLFFIITILISAFFGDLIESIFKRLNKLKNSSNFLPGHGGFFDRFDSFIFTLISYVLFNILL